MDKNIRATCTGKLMKAKSKEHDFLNNRCNTHCKANLHYILKYFIKFKRWDRRIKLIS